MKTLLIFLALISSTASYAMFPPSAIYGKDADTVLKALTDSSVLVAASDSELNADYTSTTRDCTLDSDPSNVSFSCKP
jgi:hypothetical protein